MTGEEEVRRSRVLLLIALVLSSFVTLSMITRPVVATDYVMRNAQSAGDFYDNNGSHYAGSAATDNKLSADGAYQSGGVVYGPNNPIIYTGLSASVIQSYRDGSHYFDNFKIAISIKDSSGTVLSGSRIGNLGLLDSPHDSSGSTDWLSILTEMYNFLAQFKSLPSVPNLQFGQSASGVQPPDSNGVSATWTDQGTPLAIVYDKGLSFRYQPNFPNAGVYTISVSTTAELWVEVPANPFYFYQATASSSYSFTYVYENDAGLAGDAGSDFSTARGVSLGSYSGLLYGADTIDMYKFDGFAGQNYYFSLVPPSAADYRISVYDPTWNFVVGSDSGTGRGNFGSFTAASTGSWFLKINITSGSGPYTFAISTTPFPTDFSISTNPSSWTNAAGTALCVNQAVGTTITIQGFGGFSGNVYLSGSLPPTSPPTSPFYQPTYNPVGVPVGGSGSTFALIRGATTQPWGTVQRFFVTVTGSSGSLSHSTTLIVDVSSYCDMTPNGGSVPAGSKITISDGTTVPVQDVRVGSQVIVYDVASGYQTTATITQILAISTNNLLTLHTSAGLPFRADANPRMKLHVLVNGQPILKPITEIQAGDKIYNWDLQSWVNVTSETVAYGGAHTMYDLVTNPLHSTSGAVLEYIANGYPDCPQACKS